MFTTAPLLVCTVPFGFWVSLYLNHYPVGWMSFALSALDSLNGAEFDGRVIEVRLDAHA